VKDLGTYSIKTLETNPAESPCGKRAQDIEAAEGQDSSRMAVALSVGFAKGLPPCQPIST